MYKDSIIQPQTLHTVKTISQNEKFSFYPPSNIQADIFIYFFKFHLTRPKMTLQYVDNKNLLLFFIISKISINFNLPCSCNFSRHTVYLKQACVRVIV